MDSVGEGEGGEIWENGIETCKISCMKRKKKTYENGWIVLKGHDQKELHNLKLTK